MSFVLRVSDADPKAAVPEDPVRHARRKRLTWLKL